MANSYGLCGEPAGNGPEFWAALAQEERGHAETIRRLAAILAERLRTGEISRSDQHRLLSLARDVEQSVLEAKWNEIVKTADAEFRVLIQAVVSETIAHKAKIAARLAVTSKRV